MKTIVLLLVCLICKSSAQSLLVETQEGTVEGVERLSFYGRTFRAFFGIPFAKPPVGDLRFQDPQDPVQWEGVRKADTHPEACLQLNTYIYLRGTGTPTGSEDCLYLDVYAPHGAENLPVMVYIHGGGFIRGSAEATNPATFMDEDVIVVVVQYRLATFGFLSLENDIVSGNFGLKDQLKALEWIQRNIASFGGNPESVTIFGESAGAAAVDYLTLTPKSKGFYHRAISESGSALNPWAYSRLHRRDALRVAEGLGCDTKQDETSIKTCLQRADANRILTETSKNVPFPLVNFNMVPYIDGDFLPESPMKLLQSGNFSSIPRIYGSNRDEGAMFYLMLVNDEEYSEKHFDTTLKLENEANADEIMKKINNKYFGKDTIDIEQKNKAIELMGDWYFHVGIETSTGYYKRDPGLYMYELHYAPTPHPMTNLNKGLEGYVNHATDLCLLFDQGGHVVLPLEKEEDLELRKMMVKMWVNFATTGNPTPDDSLGFIWDPVSTNDEHMQITPQLKMTKNNRKETTKFWQNLNIKQYEKKAKDEL